MSYDHWKMTEPYDPTLDVPTCCACDAPCDGTLRHPSRPWQEVYCPQCFDDLGENDDAYDDWKDATLDDPNTEA